MHIMIVELQATVSFLFHTTKTFMLIITEELKDLPMPPNNKNLEPMCNKDIIPIVQTITRRCFALTPKRRSLIFGLLLKFGHAIVDAIFVQKI